MLVLHGDLSNPKKWPCKRHVTVLAWTMPRDMWCTLHLDQASSSPTFNVRASPRTMCTLAARTAGDHWPNTYPSRKAESLLGAHSGHMRTCNFDGMQTWTADGYPLRCMTIEQMNCGSVQNWLDKEMLSPQGNLGLGKLFIGRELGES